MTRPSVPELRKVGATLQSLTGPQVEARQRDELGDPLLANFAVLARKLFPKDAESVTVRRVRLMVASYLLRSELEGTRTTPADESTARAVVAALAALDGAALDRRIALELGDPLLTFFGGLANQLVPDPDADAQAGTVHLMVLAYLARGDRAPTRSAGPGRAILP